MLGCYRAPSQDQLGGCSICPLAYARGGPEPRSANGQAMQRGGHFPWLPLLNAEGAALPPVRCFRVTSLLPVAEGLSMMFSRCSFPQGGAVMMGKASQLPLLLLLLLLTTNFAAGSSLSSFFGKVRKPGGYCRLSVRA